MRQILIIFILSLFITSCDIFRGNGEDKYYTTFTTIIEHANLVGNNEIDTGKFTILYYTRNYDEPDIIDEEGSQIIFIKIKSIDNLQINKEISLPDSSIIISSYSCSAWHYEEQNNISGTIKRTKDLTQIQKIQIELEYLDKGEKRKLLNGLYKFKKDGDYFNRNKVDYKGEYKNLRIALKEPEKVIKLDLTFEATWNIKKYGIESGISQLPKEIENFKNLEVLNLSLANLKKLPSEIGKLKKLKKLDLSYNDFKVFPLEILSLENLDTLNFAYSNLTYIPNQISQLKNLKKLILDFNRLSGFPQAITKLTNLTELSMQGDSITIIPKEIINLTKLEKLDISSFENYKRKNRPQNLEVLAGLKNLKEIYLGFDHLINLPEEFSQLEKLEILMIKFNNFKEFPKVIDKIPNLKLLIISQQEFDQNTMNELKLQKKKYKIQIDYM